MTGPKKLGVRVELGQNSRLPSLNFIFCIFLYCSIFTVFMYIYIYIYILAMSYYVGIDLTRHESFLTKSVSPAHGPARRR